MTAIAQPTEALRADLLAWRGAGTGHLASGDVFLTVTINNTTLAGKPVRIEMTKEQARTLAEDLIAAAAANVYGVLPAARATSCWA